MHGISKLSKVQFCVSFHSLYNTVKSRLFQQFSFYCFLHLTVIYFCRWQNGDIATNIQKLATPSRKRWGYVITQSTLGICRLLFLKHLHIRPFHFLCPCLSEVGNILFRQEQLCKRYICLNLENTNNIQS